MKLIPQNIREKQIAELCYGTPYSFVKWGGSYIGNRTPVIMKCALHGEWTMYLPDLFRNVRCAACKGIMRLTEEEVLRRIDEVCKQTNFNFVRWENKYINAKSRAVFNCVHHGEWTTSYQNVTKSKSGCPSCSKNGYNIHKGGFLYCFISESDKFLKVGITNNLTRRMVELKRTTPFDFELLCTVYNESGLLIRSLEKLFHQEFEKADLTGFNGASEWLKWNPKIPLWFDYLNSKRSHPNT